jgi:hypothetical protein
VLPGGVNYTTSAGDVVIAIPKATGGVSDGWYVVSPSILNNAVISGNLSVTGTSTLAGVTTTSLNNTGNTTLGDVVGDTVTVNGTTTFVNAAPTLTTGTANGVTYLNGSKVLTSGSVMTFDGSTFSLGGGTNGSRFSVRGAGAVGGFQLVVGLTFGMYP